MAPIRVRLLAALRELTGGRGEFLVEAGSWSEALRSLTAQYPSLSVAIGDDGTPKPGFLVFVDGVDSRLLDRSRPAKEVDVLPVNHGGSEYELVSWNDVERAIDKIAGQIASSGFRPDVIVGVMRGGVVPSRLLADRLGIEDIGTIEVKLYVMPGQRGERPFLRQPLTLPIKDKRVLLVDDVSDSGLTLQFSVQAVSLYMPAEVKTSTLYIKPWTKYVPDFYAEQTTKWVIFPWELNEIKRELMFFRSSG